MKSEEKYINVVTPGMRLPVKRKFDLGVGDVILIKKRRWTVSFVSDNVFGVERIAPTGIIKDCFRKKDYEYSLVEIKKAGGFS